MPYDPAKIEPRWQRYWDEHATFKVEMVPGKPKLYVLDMFPYPSGAGLHVGHPEGYTATDITCRFKRMQGFNVLHPMGWDAFGLPAERYAIRTGVHPAVTTAENIATLTPSCHPLSRRSDGIDCSRPLAAHMLVVHMQRARRCFLLVRAVFGLFLKLPFPWRIS